ncbi:uncharacterized protein A4U43_C03F24290 [Asparagus officinalis]|uniref:Uncharacterized protein n=1 Tax=Asparagus officinalis TaxID=4686 RepID=A0A5P1FEH2_ASPOF|nr:uncharacterized protein LOC109835278 [Asparagus officinalis]ONK76133.1 uncharacterized protein A4U43_C03F24290 [Asparagus officinalis]
MDQDVDEMAKAYESFIDSITSYLWAMQLSCGQKTEFTNTALENFKNQYEAFKAVCDKTEEFIDTTKKRIIAKYMANPEDLIETRGESSANAEGLELQVVNNLVEEAKRLTGSHSEAAKELDPENVDPVLPPKISEDVEQDVKIDSTPKGSEDIAHDSPSKSSEDVEQVSLPMSYENPEPVSPTKNSDELKPVSELTTDK